MREYSSNKDLQIVIKELYDGVLILLMKIVSNFGINN